MRVPHFRASETKTGKNKNWTRPELRPVKHHFVSSRMSLQLWLESLSAIFRASNENNNTDQFTTIFPPMPFSLFIHVRQRKPFSRDKKKTADVSSSSFTTEIQLAADVYYSTAVWDNVYDYCLVDASSLIGVRRKEIWEHGGCQRQNFYCFYVEIFFCLQWCVRRRVHMWCA